MTVSELIAVLQQHSPAAVVVINDDQESGFEHITEMRAEYVRLCAIQYPHPDRAPQFARDGRAANAIFLGARYLDSHRAMRSNLE